jgi:hypothetical protein
MVTKSNEVPMVVYSVRIARDKLTRFREIAAQEERTGNQKLRVMIDEVIAAHEDDKS